MNEFTQHCWNDRQYICSALMIISFTCERHWFYCLFQSGILITVNPRLQVCGWTLPHFIVRIKNDIKPRQRLTSAFCDSSFPSDSSIPSEMKASLSLCVFFWMFQSSSLCCQHYSQMTFMQIYDSNECSIIRFWGTEALKEMEVMWKRQLRAFNKLIKAPVFKPKRLLYMNNDWDKQLINIKVSLFNNECASISNHSQMYY